MSAAATSHVEAMLGRRVDLTALDTRGSRPWTPGLDRIIRPGCRAAFFSPRGVGKSLVAMIACVQVVEAGGSVRYLDLENGQYRQAGRLDAILDDRAPEARIAVSERLDHRPYARFGALDTPRSRNEWAALFTGLDLVVIDSISRALGHLGMDENSAADFTRFMVGHIDPIAEQGAAVLLLDNTGHDAPNRARGSSAKLDLIEVAYKVSRKESSPDRHGTITLERVRTRDGDEAETLTCGVGAGRYTHLAAIAPAEEQHPFAEAARAALIAGAHETPDTALGRDLLFAAVRKAAVKGSDHKLRDLLAKAVADPSTGIAHDRSGYFVPAQPWAQNTPTARDTHLGEPVSHSRPGIRQSAAPIEDAPRAESPPKASPGAAGAVRAAGALPLRGAPPPPDPCAYPAHTDGTELGPDAECVNPDRHRRRWLRHPATGRTVCDICHPSHAARQAAG
jgi:hypothetical protein